MATTIAIRALITSENVVRVTTALKPGGLGAPTISSASLQAEDSKSNQTAPSEILATSVLIEIDFAISESLPIPSWSFFEATKLSATATVTDWQRIAKLARISVSPEEISELSTKLNAILEFVQEISELDVRNVEPLTSVIPMQMKRRADVVTAGGDPDAVLRNAPEREGNFFVVPKVVE